MAIAGDHVNVLVGGFDLTADSNQLLIIDQRNLYDVTAFGDMAHHFIPSTRMCMLEHNGFMNAMTARSHPALKSATLEGAVSVMLGQNNAPALGDPTYVLVAQQGKYEVLPQVGRHVPFMAMFANLASAGGWGIVVAPPTSITTSAVGTSTFGASTNKGGLACLHILQAVSSDTYTFTLEGSTTGAFNTEQTVLATFSVNGTTLTSDYKVLSGVIPAYVRWKATRAGSAGNTIRFAASLLRY